MGTHTHSPEVNRFARTPLEPLMDVGATARFLGVSQRQVYKLLARGELPATRVGRRLRFVPDDLRAYLERHREAAP